MPDRLSAADIETLKDLIDAVTPGLLPLSCDQASLSQMRMTGAPIEYVVADANGLEFATVRNQDEETTELIVRAINALPALLDAAEKAARLETQLAAIKAADPDLFDPRGGYSRGAAYETYGSAGHHLREEYLAAIGLTPEEDADDE